MRSHQHGSIIDPSYTTDQYCPAMLAPNVLKNIPGMDPARIIVNKSKMPTSWRETGIDDSVLRFQGSQQIFLMLVTQRVIDMNNNLYFAGFIHLLHSPVWHLLLGPLLAWATDMPASRRLQT
jgi:hypothetical protein